MDYSVNFECNEAETVKTDLVVYLVPQKDENPDLVHVPDLPAEPLNDFDAGFLESQIFYEGAFQGDKLALIGLGDLEELDVADAAEAAGLVFDVADEESAEDTVLSFPLFWELDRADLAKSLTLGLTLGGYTFDEFQHEDDEEDQEDKKEPELGETKIILGDKRSSSTVERGFNRGSVLGRAIQYTRNLANTPANHLVPDDLAAEARSLAREHKPISVNVWNQDQLNEEGMDLLLAVGKGSENPPRFVHLEYHPDSSNNSVAVAGKGVTFDTGGISIKPSKNMGEMKFDMCGAATVLGLTKACAEMELPVHLHGLVPTAENMPGQRAVKPGDVVTGYYDKSVEIINTDAEGRLLLADTLGFASRQLGEELDCLIDFATLTGACITALGHYAAGLMGIDDKLCEQLQAAGNSTGEPVWRLPLWEDYSEALESDVADVKNVGGNAGTIVAGAFLREFVDEEKIKNWAHLDIAGTGWNMPELSYRPKGGTGFGVHLIDEFLRSHYL